MRAADTPFGGGAGMVLKPEPMYRAVRDVLARTAEYAGSRRVLIMDPSGPTFTQSKAKELADYDQLVFICGHYEGFDARIYQLADEAVSIGDFVLTGGELAALILIDAIALLLPYVLGDPTGTEDDSHAMGLLEYPHYTRPPEFRGWKAPDILLSGDHAKIDKWRRQQALERTFKKRPDMLEKAELSKADLKFIERLKVTKIEGE